MPKRLSAVLLPTFRAVDWFIPDTLRTDAATLGRARIFVFSHLFGPAMGQSISLDLWQLDPHPGYAFWVVVCLITSFWALPFLLKLTGRLIPLAFTTVEILTFATLFGSYQYGGVSSPFLPWLLNALLLAFFYLGDRPKLRYAVLAMFSLNVLGFYLVYAMTGAFPERVPVAQMSGLGIVSVLSATVYMAMMALYYANLVGSQSELEHEVQRHRATATNLREAKEEAEKANRQKSEFLAKMSHELRTPLNAVIGYSEMLLEDAEIEGSQEQQAEDLRKINGAGKHLLSLVTDVLDLSKIEAGKMELFNERFDLNGLLDDLIAAAQPLCAKNGNELVVERGDNLGVVEGDAAKLRQVALNLLGNAAKFTKQGRVTLKAARERMVSGDSISITVHDTGIGISRENLPKLFQIFSQLEVSNSAKYGGPGLGLELAQKLCRLMGGDVTVESELGVGSTFTIRLPASLAKMVERSSEIDWAADPADSDGAERRDTILVVDDDPAGRDLMQRMLVKEGFRPVLGDDPLKALALARKVKPSAIILDVMMPGMNGWEVLRTLKADSGLEAVPVVMLTVLDDRRTGLAFGAVEHLVKPVDRDVLMRVLDRICPRSQPGRPAGRRPTKSIAADA
jgi:signal transduction histidine kinase/CheY-like chemotaxis protein